MVNMTRRERMVSHDHNRWVCGCMPIGERILKRVLEYFIIWLIGGAAYVGIEMLWRGYSHWSMFILGGLCLLIVGLLNEGCFPMRFGLIPQGLMGGCIITALEFVCGLIVNVGLGLSVWDYSDLPLNIMGQVCIPYTFAWIFLAMVAVVVDDWIRYLFFGGPHSIYVWWIDPVQ